MSAKSSTGMDAKSYLTFNSSLITLILSNTGNMNKRNSNITKFPINHFCYAVARLEMTADDGCGLAVFQCHHKDAHLPGYIETLQLCYCRHMLVMHGFRQHPFC